MGKELAMRRLKTVDAPNKAHPWFSRGNNEHGARSALIMMIVDQMVQGVGCRLQISPSQQNR